MLRSAAVDWLLTLFAPGMLTVRKRTNDDLGLFVIISSNEHRPLAPVPTIGTRSMGVKTADVLPSTAQEDREWCHFHLCPDLVLLVGESETLG
jgi:hypothetical protein